MSHSCSSRSMHACLLDCFIIPYVWGGFALKCAILIQAIMVSTRNVGLLCDYDQKILKYSSTSKADREEMHWKLMPLYEVYGLPKLHSTPFWVLLNYFYGIEDKLRWSLSVWTLQHVSRRLVIWWGFSLILRKSTHFHRCSERINWCSIQHDFVSTEHQTSSNLLQDTNKQTNLWSDPWSANVKHSGKQPQNVQICGLYSIMIIL